MHDLIKLLKIKGINKLKVNKNSGSKQFNTNFAALINLNFCIMSNGTVKFFNNSKGYGFITPDDGSRDVFVHMNGLVDKINEGDKVSYEVEEGQKGLNAVNVKVV